MGKSIRCDSVDRSIMMSHRDIVTQPYWLGRSSKLLIEGMDWSSVRWVNIYCVNRTIGCRGNRIEF